jgi:hypothetical protein
MPPAFCPSPVPDRLLRESTLFSIYILNSKGQCSPYVHHSLRTLDYAPHSFIYEFNFILDFPQLYSEAQNVYTTLYPDFRPQPCSGLWVHVGGKPKELEKSTEQVLPGSEGEG